MEKHRQHGYFISVFFSLIKAVETRPKLQKQLNISFYSTTKPGRSFCIEEKLHG
jgi:hypothetical protein